MDNSWGRNAERFVLYLDIMGFKDRVSRTDHQILRNQLIDFSKKWKTKIKPLETNEHIKYAQFSDSIIVTTDKTEQKQLNLITRTAIIIMQEALKLGFPIKGALSCGKFSFEESEELYFGQPLVDAFLLEEKVFYYGVVVHNTAEKKVKQASSRCKDFYSKIDIPLKDGSVNHYQLNWNMMNELNDTENITDIAIKWLESIEEQVSGRPRVYIQNTRKVLSNINETNKKNQ